MIADLAYAGLIIGLIAVTIVGSLLFVWLAVLAMRRWGDVQPPDKTGRR